MGEDLARTSRSRAGGFSLVEITVALALVSVIMLSGLSLLVLQPRIQERTRAGEAALHAIEAALETLRAEELPLSSGLLVPGDAYPINASAPDLEMEQLTVSPAMLQVTRVVLSGVARLHGRFGKNIVVGMLCGSKSAKIKKWRLDRLSTFGLLESFRKFPNITVLSLLSQQSGSR